MVYRYLYHLVFILYLSLIGGESVDLPLPSLSTDYYSGFVEGVFISGDLDRESTQGVSLVWVAYDGELKVLRVDSYDVDERLGEGPISRIEDRKIGVMYTISRHSHKCIIEPLHGSGMNQSADDSLPITTLQDLLFLSLNYTYKGTSVARSAIVDTWSSTYNLTNYGVSIKDALFQIAFTRPGTPIENIKSYVQDPILWQFSISGNESSISFSTVLNFYEWSYEKPSNDAFDISVCISSEDYKLLVLLIPGQLSEVEEDHLHYSIRSATANYTGIYPFQIGNIKIIAENGSSFITSLHILNLTSEAQIASRVSAHDAVESIKSGLMPGGRFPFSVELSPGVQVYPVLHELSGTIPCPTNTFASQVPPCTVSPKSPCPSSAVIITSTLTVTTTNIYPLSTCTALVPTNTPQIMTITQTVTETIPCQIDTVIPYTTAYPTSGTSSHELGTGGAVGLAIGSFAAGVLCTFLSIILCVVCCNWCNRQTMRSAGWKPIPRTNHHVTKEMDYFQ